MQLGGVAVPLVRCSCRPGRHHLAAAAAEGWHISVEDARIGSKLQPLLEALLPLGGTVGGQPLHLLLEGCFLDGAACSHSCPALAQLHGLTLIELEVVPGSVAGLLPALLRQAPRLRSLALDESAGEGRVPPCVLALQGLTSLCLDGMSLQRLPEGAYLQSERCVVIGAAPRICRCGCTACRLRGKCCAALLRRAAHPSPSSPAPQAWRA